MSRILYGVSGEGSGHSSRATEMARHLQACGHEVRVVSYDRGYRNMSAEFETIEIEGLHIVCENNRVRPLKTLWHNLRRGGRAVQRIKALLEQFRTFQPDCVISDFEPTTAWLATLRGLPLISLDNQHRMRYMKFRSPPRLLLSRWITVLLIRLMVPAPTVALATTYYYGERKNERIFLFPPILRREVMACKPHDGDHHLVYVTSHFEHLLTLLKSFPDKRFVVYGCNRDGVDGNLCYRPFSTEGFLRDLESCQSVVATAGFTLISEAIYLGKPYLALPMIGQFEQQLNAICLAELGFGVNVQKPDRASIEDFFGRLPTLKSNVMAYAAGHQQQGRRDANSAIKSKLESLLADDLAVPGARLC
ncbi:MAG: MJ1255/VC2487 family glycosyltransferase [Pseudohongiella sp.]|uniref:MJ1255/VC2487 family glycosyltransferase n=1 Tax=Pseudohongiella sp. TaxID=1979412 RepID=UPI0034A0703E